MASQEQSYRAGETKAEAQEKAGQMIGEVRTRAEEAKDKTCETARTARATGASEATNDKPANPSLAAKHSLSW